MHQVIARTWRPQRFSEVIGQRHISQTLQNALRLNRVAHGYVFSGQRGVGKTTMARLLAKALNCHKAPAPGQPASSWAGEPCGECDSCREVAAGRSVDVLEIDAASNRGIDAIRELRENVRYAPARDRFKVFIIDEAHQITPEGFNALLKTLEEPPAHVVFILATTELHELPETILSRCQHFSFHAASFAEILEHLQRICAAEGVEADAQALAALAAAAGGSLRDALSRLEQAMAAFGSKLEGAAVLRLLGAVPSQMVEDIFTAVEAQNREQILTTVARLVEEGYQLPHFCSQLVRAVRNMLVVKLAGEQPHLLEASPEETARLAALSAKFSEEDLLRFLEILLRLHQDMRHSMEPRFQAELGLLKLVEARRLVAIEKVLAQMEPDSAPRAVTSDRAAGQSGVGNRNLGSTAAPAQSREAPRSAPAGPSPFERDQMRKRSFEASVQRPVMTAPIVAVEEHAPPAAETGLTVPTRPAATAVDEVVHVEGHSREENWAHEILRRLEERGKHGLVSLVDAAQWAFGEEEVRLRPASAGIAKILSDADLRTLGEIVSDVVGHKVRLTLADDKGQAGGSVSVASGRGASKAGSPGAAGDDPAGSGVEEKVRQDPELREFEQLFGKPVSGVRRWKG